jgi:hypothetical protein
VGMRGNFRAREVSHLGDCAVDRQPEQYCFSTVSGGSWKERSGVRRTRRWTSREQKDPPKAESQGQLVKYSRMRGHARESLAREVNHLGHCAGDWWPKTRSFQKSGGLGRRAPKSVGSDSGPPGSSRTPPQPNLKTNST